MKKISNILVVLMLMASLASLALADDEPGENPEGEFEGGTQGGENETTDNNETGDSDGNETDGPDEDGLDNETEEEIGIMNSSLGAEIRLLQLEKAILKNILKGERAVEVLKAMGYNTSNLSSILAEMSILLGEVRAANSSSNDSVQIFVDLKSDARNLTKQFRETVKELLDDEKMKELRERVREIVGDELENYSKKIRNRIRQFNRNQLHRLYGIIGETNNSLIDEYDYGNVSLEQVKSQICKMVNQMTKERKYQIFSEVKEGNIKKKIQAQAFMDYVHNKGNGKGRGKPQ